MKLVIAVLLVILCLLCPTSAYTRKWEDRSKLVTHFRYEITLHCPLEKTWCYTGYYREWDVFNSNDDITVDPFHCTTGASTHVATFTLKGGDHDDFSKTYEPELELYHNCSKYSYTHKLIGDFYNPNVKTHSVQESYEYEIFNKGETSHVKSHIPLFTFTFNLQSFVVEAMRGKKFLPPGIGRWFDSKSYSLPSESGNWATSKHIHFHDDVEKKVQQ